jgi:hypothetical protein
VLDISMGISKPMQRSVISRDVSQVGQKSTYHESGIAEDMGKEYKGVEGLGDSPEP